MYHSALGDFESLKAEQFYVNVLRQMTPDQKWRVAFELWQMAVETSRNYVRLQHPDWLESQVQTEVAQRILKNHGTARLPVSSG